MKNKETSQMKRSESKWESSPLGKEQKSLKTQPSFIEILLKTLLILNNHAQTLNALFTHKTEQFRRET